MIGKFTADVLSNADYHSGPEASASRLKAKTIRHMLAPRYESSVFDLGTAIHSLVLEGLDVFRERHPVRPSEWKDWRTKDAQAWRAEQQAEGRIVLDRSDAATVKRVAAGIRENASACALLERSIGMREVSYFWQDEEFDVPCRCRFDALAIDGGQYIAVDLKSTQSAHPAEFGRSAVNFGYDLQAAHYSAGFEAVEGDQLLGWTIIAVEKAEPYGVAVYELGEEWIARGRESRREGLQRFSDWWHAGRPTDEPVYPTTITRLQLPRWA